MRVLNCTLLVRGGYEMELFIIVFILGMIGTFIEVGKIDTFGRDEVEDERLH